MVEQLKFIDFKTRKPFLTDIYELEERATKNGIKYFAIALAPSGIKAYKIVSKAFYDSMQPN